VTAQPPHPDATSRSDPVLCVCRDLAARTLLRDCAGEAGKVVSSAAEALLVAARTPVRAVVLEINGGTLPAREFLEALERARPGVPCFAVTAAEGEAEARALVGRGLTDYFVLPGGVGRLRTALHPPPAKPTGPEPSSEPGSAQAEPPAAGPPARLFEAACHLAGLALEQPLPLFRDGCRLIIETFGAARGCAFQWSEEGGRPVLAITLGGDEGLGLEDPEPVRAAADRCLRTGEGFALAAGTAGAPPDGMVCVPVCDESSTFGAVCFSARTAAGTLTEADVRPAEALARALARLCRAAESRHEYARMALRDVETGLLKADPFLTYVESRIAHAGDRQSSLALVLLEPEASVVARAADSPARIGLAVRQALARGWEAGRLGTARYAVAVPAPAEPAAAGAGDAFEDAARRLAEAAPRAGAEAPLRAALARFPQDGTTAQALVAAAERRLRTPGDRGR
jgi:hypothetical protein